LHGYRCNTDRALIEEKYPEYLKLFEQELFKLRQLAGQVGGKTTAESGKLEEARSKIDPEKLQEARIKTGLKNVENGFFTPGHPNCILTFDSQSSAGTIGGTVSYSKGVGVFDKEKKEERRRLGIGEFSEETRQIRQKTASDTAQYLM
jgi:predicted KAP-like P-loop ATPase